MRKYETRDVEVFKREVCIGMACDSCGRLAEYPENELFEWGGAGTATGSLEYRYSIDGECQAERLDLCYECAERIADAVRRGEFKQKGERS